MEIGAIFLIVACLLLAFDFILLLTTKVRAEEKKKREIAFFAFILACGLVTAAYFRLTLSFVKDNFSLWEVYAYSSSSLSLAYKIGDPWIGSSGSMLFVTFLFTLVSLVYRLKGLEQESVFRTTTYKILDVFFVILLFVTLLKSPFELLPVTPPDGVGLNPLLQTFWVLVHPPVIFLGYVFVFFAFALTLAGMITGELKEQERKTLKLSLYAAWLFLALGIALGGWWSYEVLGWGGYWAWDPVETASLLPWLALTAYFHLPARSKDLAKEFTLTLTFFMIIFATALTRGGLLESVHAFGESPVGPVLLGVAFCVLFYFFYLARRANKPLYAFDLDSSSLPSLSLFVAYWSLMFLLIICFFGDTAPIIGGVFSDTPMATSVDFYNKWCYPFTLAFVAALMGCNSGLKLKEYAGVIAAVLVIGAVLAVLGQPTPNTLANFGLPLILAAGVAIAYNFVRLLPRRNSSFLWGKTIVHFAIIIILIGVFVSSSMAEESDNLFATSDSTVEALGATIAVNGFTVYPGTGSVYFPQHNLLLPEYSALKIDVTINERGRIYHEPLWLYYYPNHGVVSEPLIISTLRGDLYVYMQHTDTSFDSLRFALMGEEIQPESVVLRMKKNPLIGFVWAGIVLMGIGMTILLIGELLRRDRKE
jgi:cytochrome c-type biogenesis protein CcmF